MSLTERLADHFRAHPDQWLDGRDLSKIAGAYAWRTRVSELRKLLGMQIENRVRYIREHEPSCPVVHHCDCAKHFKVSEYRFVTRTQESAA